MPNYYHVTAVLYLPVYTANAPKSVSTIYLIVRLSSLLAVLPLVPSDGSNKMSDVSDAMHALRDWLVHSSSCLSKMTMTCYKLFDVSGWGGDAVINSLKSLPCFGGWSKRAISLSRTRRSRDASLRRYLLHIWPPWVSHENDHDQCLQDFIQI